MLEAPREKVRKDFDLLLSELLQCPNEDLSDSSGTLLVIGRGMLLDLQSLEAALQFEQKVKETLVC